MMARYSFKNDYSEGCHPNILEALARSNFQQEAGYGLDSHSTKAKEMIRSLIKNQEAKIHFIAGGTLSNLLVISSLLRSYQSVISCECGHILQNETAAIEATGHKIHSIKSDNGKLTVQAIDSLINEIGNNFPHSEKPGLIYISNPTEVGTIYYKDELKELSDYCRENDLYLYMDGARLGHALTAEGNDINIEDIARLTDVFYIGGTKNGALLGEAIVINTNKVNEEFEYSIKQRGALMAKGRILGIQFEELLKDNLYFKLAKHANNLSMQLKNALLKKGYPLLSDTVTNQIFPIMDNQKIEELLKKFDFYIWQKIDKKRSAIRLITSWATEEDKVNDFIQEL